MVATVTQILRDLDFELPWQDIDRDVRNILRSLAEARPEIRRPAGTRCRNPRSRSSIATKALISSGSLRYGGSAWPVVLPILVDDDNKLYVDTLICDEDELSVVFSFTRSYFMVDAPYPYALVDYLNALLPGKKRSELYTAIGMHKHGKTEFYRGFLTHLARSKDQFVIAPGIKGMVMTVFTLPSYQTVFKIIKDRVRAAEEHHARTGQREVPRSSRRTTASAAWRTRRSSFVLRCRARDFHPQLIDELKAVAASSITLNDDLVIIEHLYTERLMTAAQPVHRDCRRPSRCAKCSTSTATRSNNSPPRTSFPATCC